MLRVDLRTHVPEPGARCSRSSQPEHTRALRNVCGTHGRTRLCAESQPRFVGAPAILGAERPLMDSVRLSSAGSSAHLSLRAQWRVLVQKVPSPTRSGRGSLWESNGYTRVKNGTGGSPGQLNGAPNSFLTIQTLHPARWLPRTRSGLRECGGLVIPPTRGLSGDP